MEPATTFTGETPGVLHLCCLTVSWSPPSAPVFNASHKELDYIDPDTLLHHFQSALM